MVVRRSSIVMQNLVEIERRTSAWEDEVWCFSLFCTFVARSLNGDIDAVGLLQQEIALAYRQI